MEDVAGRSGRWRADASDDEWAGEGGEAGRGGGEVDSGRARRRNDWRNRWTNEWVRRNNERSRTKRLRICLMGAHRRASSLGCRRNRRTSRTKRLSIWLICTRI